MKLQDIMVDTKSVWIDYPGCPGLEFEIASISRKELINMRKSCMYQKLDRKTKLMMDTLDEDKFTSRFAQATVKNWKGFKLKYVQELMLADLKGVDPEEELDYDPEQAELLLASSTEFDNWVNEVAFDLETFRD